jgi:putative oxidoreductase
MRDFIRRLNKPLEFLTFAEFLAPLALRLYLVPVFWMAGSNKLQSMESTIAWFGNPDWGLGLPLPALLAWLATLTEAIGAVLLLVGLGVRWISLPLMITMVVAAFAVHWQNGWLAIAERSGFFATDRTVEAAERLDRAKDILQEHANYGWLTEHGNFVVLNNGIEFAATYFVMLLALLYLGSGKAGVDYWLNRKFHLGL